MTENTPLIWIWQHAGWPAFTWQEQHIQPLLREVRFKQGMLLGKAGVVNVGGENGATLDTLLQNILTSSAIENEHLNAQSVRSSLAKRLGLTIAADVAYPTSQRTEGLAELMMDAIGNLANPLTMERLFQWHQWLFPETELLLPRLHVGQLRGDEPMQVVSGRIDKPTVHFEAPPRAGLEQNLNEFIEWFNHSRSQAVIDPLLRAAICHFWFVTVHPFDDGNGRLTRSLTDLALAQADAQSIRLYAMSVAILENRSDYYRVLESSQRGGLDISEWLVWFLRTLAITLQTALDNIQRILAKTQFWQCFRDTELSKEQIKVLNRLLDSGDKGFVNGISAAQYQKVAKVSKATATRHLTDLLAKGCIEKLVGGGRNTRYQVKLSSASTLISNS